MKFIKWPLIFVAFVIGCEIGTCVVKHYDVEAAPLGLIFTNALLEDGATDGSEGTYKLGNDVWLIVRPDSEEFALINPLKGRRVEFRIQPTLGR